MTLGKRNDIVKLVLLASGVLKEIWCLKAELKRWWYSAQKYPDFQTWLYCIWAMAKLVCVLSRKLGVGWDS